jgi:hypothetical protein
MQAQTPVETPQPLSQAAAPLARSIASLLPPRAIVSLEFQALAVVPPAEWSSFRSGLQDELRRSGVEAKESAQLEPRVRVAVSENVRGLLLIAEVVNNEARQIVMAPWARLNQETKLPLRIQITPLVEQREPILDTLLFPSGLDMLLLSPSKLTGFHLTNGKWMVSGQASIALARPIPRDARGKLALVAGVFQVFLPGTTCTGQNAEPLALSCTGTNEPWQLNLGDTTVDVHWMNGLNVLASGGVRGSFYNAVGGWFAGSDGKIENRAGEPVPGTDAWGNDLAAIENTCGAARTAIVAMSGNSDHDQVQAFFASGDTPSAASAPLALAGTVTALWPAERPTQATLVIHNSKTGNYEASRLSLACAE